MTRIVSLVNLSPADATRIRDVAERVDLVEAGGYFEGEYGATWPSPTIQRYVRGHGQGSRAERDAILADAEIILGGFPYPLDLKSRAPALRWFHQTPAGASNLRTGDLWGSELLVTTSRGLGETTAIAEYTIAAMLYFTRTFDTAIADAHAGHFEYRSYAPQAVETKTICVIGAGGIGREVARLSKALGMCVVGTRRSASGPLDDFDQIETPGALHSLLAQSDVVAVCCQWTPETTNLLNSSAFAAMRPGAIMINVARGEIVDEAALLEALDQGQLRGAALDVYVGEFERLPPNSLWQHPRVLITPHTSGMTDRSRRRSTQLFCENLVHYLDGRPLANTVDWDQGY
jgi:phosphoglycerate dehydrogenase-like enzyme